MSDAPTEWSLEGFCDHFQFVHETMPDHKFVWVLGAGASLASGIPAGGQLVDRWLRELKVRFAKPDERNLPLEQWATAKNLEIPRFDYGKAASFYPQVYERRFRKYPEEGYACLENLMSGKDPSPGYSILAKTLSDERHSAVITTNFDNLVADALLIYTDTFPFVCGHESLASFVRVAMRRPLVCKIHRDLLLGPKNDRRSLTRLHEAWAAALRALLEHYTPIFIGYGGNDDSLMGLLESFDPGEIKGQMLWCYYEKDQPSERIRDLVSQHRGVLVPAPDFDLLMVLLGERMGIEPLDATILERAEKRTKTYRERILRLDTADHPSARKALAAIYEREGGWWAWELKARAETNPNKRETIYRQGTDQYPKSHELLGNFALFVTEVRKCHDEAEKLYRKALELEPNHALITGNFANFMTDVRKGHDEAEKLYRKALELDPNDAAIAGNLANLMWQVRKGHDEAEKLYRKALGLDPNHALNTGSFANFMTDVRKDHDEAEKLYRKALELDSNNANITCNFAIFLTDVRKDHDEAEKLYRKALELAPNHANIMGNFGAFYLARGRTDEAASLLHRAKELNGGEMDQVAAEIAFHSAILVRSDGRDDTAELDQLIDLLDHGFTRLSSSYDNVLEFARSRLSAEDYALYAALADAILDADKLDGAKELLEKRSRTSAPKAKKAAKKKGPGKTSAKRKPPKKRARKKRS